MKGLAFALGGLAPLLSKIRLLFSPFGLVIAKAALIGYAGWKRFAPFFLAILSRFKLNLEPILTSFNELKTNTKNLFSSFYNNIFGGGATKNKNLKRQGETLGETLVNGVTQSMKGLNDLLVGNITFGDVGTSIREWSESIDWGEIGQIMGDGLSDAFGGLVDLTGSMTQWLESVDWTTLGSKLGIFLKDVVSAGWNILTGALAGTDGEVTGISIVRAIVRGVQVGKGMIKTSLKAVADFIWGALVGLLGSSVEGSIDWGGRIIDSIIASFGDSVDWAMDLGRTIIDAIVEGWNTSTEWVLELGKNIIDTILAGILAAKDHLIDGVRNALQSIRDLLPLSDAKEGPLSTLTDSGQALVNTLREGILSVPPLGAVLENQVLKIPDLKLAGAESGTSEVAHDFDLPTLEPFLRPLPVAPPPATNFGRHGREVRINLAEGAIQINASGVDAEEIPKAIARSLEAELRSAVEQADSAIES